MKKLYILFIILLTATALQAQNISVNSAVGQNPNTLINTVLAGEGVYIYNGKFNNSTGNISTPQVGRFYSNGYPGVQMDSGMVMTTGNITVAVGPNNSESSSQAVSPTYSDAQLSSIASSTIYGCATIDFDFVGMTDVISFLYTFASEEYPEYVCSTFNDVFAFLITGPDPATGQNTTRNVAIIPGTVSSTNPNGIAVAINSVNPGVAGTSGGGGTGCYYDYSQYYNDNADATGIQYDGYTTKLTATAHIVPCAVYHMHLSVCNVGDNAYDSGVFLEYGSFYSPAVNLQLPTRDTVEAGCPGRVPFSLMGSSYTGGQAQVYFGGELVNGTDFTCTNDQGVTMNATNNTFSITNDSVSYLTFTVNPNLDFSTPKEIELYIETSICQGYPGMKAYDTMIVTILPADVVQLRDTTINCENICTQVGVEVVSGNPPLYFQWIPEDNISRPQQQYSAAYITQDADYRVAVTNKYGCTTDTADVAVRITTGGGGGGGNTIEERILSQVRIYPNPADEVLHIAGDEVQMVELYNVSGQKVLSSKCNGHLDINTEKLSSGAYQLKLITAQGTATTTVIVR